MACAHEKGEGERKKEKGEGEEKGEGGLVSLFRGERERERKREGKRKDRKPRTVIIRLPRKY